MGWLFDLAERQGKTKKGKLAEELYRSDHWEGPEYKHIRSVENILRAIDKGGLTKLEDWINWFPSLLAEILGVTEETIWEEADLAREASEAPDSMYWLADLKGAKPLDLAREDPFPGLPPQVLTPHMWEAHWWRARPDEEAEVVATFLRARRLARVVRAETWTEALDNLPDRGAVLVILTTEEATLEANVEDVPARLALLVAAQTGAPATENPGPWKRGSFGIPSIAESGWGKFSNPQPEEWIEPLLRWVHGRLEPDGHFDFDLGVMAKRMDAA